jgi:uncharacterized protein
MTYGSFRWRHTFMSHWRLSPDEVAARLPSGLSLDTWDGDAVLSLVAFDGTGPVPRALLGSRALAYRQVNIRTYVIGTHGPGIWVFDTMVDRRFATAARLLGMPYRKAPVRYLVGGNELQLRADGILIEGRAETEPPRVTEAGTLEHFALERYWAYSTLPGGKGYGVRISHHPWQVRSVNLMRGNASGPLGFHGGAWATAHLAEDLDVDVVEIAGQPAELHAP